MIKLLTAIRRWSEKKSEFSFWFAVVGGIASAASLISLIHRIFGIGIAPIFQEFIQFYRDLSYYFIDMLAFPLPFHLPGWYKDLVGLGMYQSVLIGRAWLIAHPGWGYGTATVLFFLFWLFSFSLFGAVGFAWSILALPFAPQITKSDSWFNRRAQREMPEDMLSQQPEAIKHAYYFFVSLASSLLVLALYFALNAGIK